MFDAGGRGSTRRWGLPWFILGCVLLSTGAWGQSADAGRMHAGGVVPPDVLDAGQPLPDGQVVSGSADGGQAALASSGPSVVAASDATRVEVTLHGFPVTVTASSVLVEAKEPGRYGLAHLLDEDPGTIWAEGAKGTGAGEWVELSFPPDAPVHAFLVTPGNPKSAKLYKANARPRKAKLELKLAEGRRLDYVLDFPRDFPAGGAIYVDYARQFAVKSARLTVLTVWPGSRYPDLCLGGFVPVFRGPRDPLETYLGMGSELAPTLALFMRSPLLVFELLPPETSGVPARLRAYSRVPHDGPLPPPEEEYDMHRVLSGWDRYSRDLDSHAAGASVQNELFRFMPAPGGKSYVFDPMARPKRQDSFSNFRVHWARVDGGWHVVGVDIPYREQTADD